MFVNSPDLDLLVGLVGGIKYRCFDGMYNLRICVHTCVFAYLFLCICEYPWFGFAGWPSWWEQV